MENAISTLTPDYYNYQSMVCEIPQDIPLMSVDPVEPLMSISPAKDTVSTLPAGVGEADASINFVDDKPTTIEELPEIKFTKKANVYVGSERLGLMHVPENPVKENGKVDVALFINGGHGVEHEKRKLNAVVVDVSRPGFSSVYTNLAQAAPFEHWLNNIQGKLDDMGVLESEGGHDKIDRVSLTSFSAGYGAVGEILRHSANVEKVESVILLDSLHGSKLAGVVNPASIQPFINFAQLAAQGDKSMVITHSEVQTLYASTTETADTILDSVGLERNASKKDIDIHGSKSYMHKEITQLSEAHKGNLHIIGHSGNDKAAHAKQLHNSGNVWDEYLTPSWMINE